MARVSLPRLQLALQYIRDGKPTAILQKHWDELATGVETQLNSLEDALDVIAEQAELLEQQQEDMAEVLAFLDNFADAISPLIISTEARVTTLEARINAFGIP